MQASEALNKREVINISVKRQFTIPQKYFTALGFDNEAECFIRDGGLFVKPLNNNGDGGDFGEQILADLISQGYEGHELLTKFKKYSREIRPAVQRLIEDADAFAKSGEGKIPLDELFEKVD